jgi:L-ascorbate metabolism protein UlaG (beta-lactamase superfamily)
MDMLSNSKTRIFRLFITLIIFTMSLQGYSQGTPEYDKIVTSAGNVNMFFLGHASLLFRIDNYAIYFDPVEGFGDYKNLPKADLILITHDHPDHLDTGLIDKIKKEGTLVFCNDGSLTKIPWAMPLKAGDRQEINKIVIEAVPAYNIVNERAKGQPFHPKGAGIGYVLTIGNKRFYVAGDSENTPEMKALKNIEVAFLPMNLPYTMTPEMVADAAKAFKPAILYPYHYGETDVNKLVTLLKDTDIKVQIRNLK